MANDSSNSSSQTTPIRCQDKADQEQCILRNGHDREHVSDTRKV